MAPQRLGQHFLADASWRMRIASAMFGTGVTGSDQTAAVFAVKPGGVWVEIGAGHGEMTELLAGVAERVVAVELDPRLVLGLAERFARQRNVTVVAGDILALDLAQLAGAPQFTVYGNLPYYITSPIVHRLLSQFGHGLTSAFLLIQTEVAERLLAQPGSRDRGYFSAVTQLYATPEILLRIPPGAFRPPPKVNSTLVSLRPPGRRAALDIADEQAFVEFLKICFAQKRKTLRNNLQGALPKACAAEALNDAGIAAKARAEQLSLEDLARLFTAVRRETPPNRAATR